MSKCPVLPVILLVFLFASSTALARDWLIAPDGSGDAPNIAAAIDSCQGDDRIVLLDGVFTGEGNRDNNNMEKSIVILSQSDDPTHCIIDCQSTPDEPHGAMDFYGGG